MPVVGANFLTAIFCPLASWMSNAKGINTIMPEQIFAKNLIQPTRKYESNDSMQRLLVLLLKLFPGKRHSLKLNVNFFPFRYFRQRVSRHSYFDVFGHLLTLLCYMIIIHCHHTTFSCCDA